MSDSEITVIRSAAGCLSAMALINELKRENVRVVGIDCDPLSAGLYLCEKGYVVPRGDAPNFLEQILKLCDIERPNAILPGPEEEIIVLAKNKEVFNQRNILVMCPDYNSVAICTDKIETYRAFRSLGIPTPRIYGKGNVKFPCIIKPRAGRGGKGVFKAEDANELEFYSKKVANPIIQEFLDGIEYTIDILADLNGNPLSIVPRARLQVESGISVKGRTVYDEEIINYCRRISKELSLIGPSCVQCIRSRKEVKFTEINPRFGGGSILSIKADPTIVPNLIRIIRRETPVPSNGFREGLMMLRYYNELFVNPIENAGASIEDLR